MQRFVIKFSNNLYPKYNGLGYTQDFSEARVFTSRESAVNLAEIHIDPEYNFEVSECSYEVLPVKLILCNIGSVKT